MAKHGRRPRYPPEDRIEKSAVTLKTDIYLDDDLGESVVNLDDDDIFKLVRIEPEPAKTSLFGGSLGESINPEHPSLCFLRKYLPQTLGQYMGRNKGRH